MQISNERQNAEAEKEIVTHFDSCPDNIYDNVIPIIKSGSVWQLSIVCNPTEWENIKPKKKRKRKREFPDDVIRCTTQSGNETS